MRVSKDKESRDHFAGLFFSLGMTNLTAERTSGDMQQPVSTTSKCLGCGAALHSMGVEQFRVGGTSGGWNLLFGELAELGEEMIGFEVLACQNCRRVELRVPEATAEPV